mmetsp:Transcript_8982/g.22138  ORF Transcript_8982/g.22138 Transcript_8982/m.22138 type:complete len:286 (+) Transcript_8982:252-1109(+)
MALLARLLVVVGGRTVRGSADAVAARVPRLTRARYGTESSGYAFRKNGDGAQDLRSIRWRRACAYASGLFFIGSASFYLAPSPSWATTMLDFVRALPAERERRATSEICRDLLGERCLEYSIHKLEGKAMEQVGRVFPDLSEGDRSGLLAVPTFQRALFDLNPDSGAPPAAVQMEMNKLHLNFVALESEVYGELTRLGYFCDSIDPLTGCAMHSRSGERYSEAVGSRELLGYDLTETSCCHLIVHPQFGSCCYPVTLFSNAPEDVVRALMENTLQKLRVVPRQPL